MTDKEIDKLLQTFEKMTLEDVKKYLKEEAVKNNAKLVQKTFETYLTTNVFGNNLGTMPVYNQNYHNKMVFSNNASLYIINDLERFKISKFILLHKSSNYQYTHRVLLADSEIIDKYISKVKQIDNENYSNEEEFDIEDSTTSRLYTKGMHIAHEFNINEINNANILLNNPNIMISTGDMPIIHAENDIGKAYIIGLKKQKHSQY